MQSLDDLRRIIRRIETRRPPRAAAEPLERVVGGELVETGAGSLLVVRREYPLEHRHGRVPLDGVRHAPLDVLARVARVESEALALLAALAPLLERAGAVVTFNGAGFDLPLLETRFVLARRRWPATLPHLDLLRPSRRVWTGCFDDCRLGTLERDVLGLAREEDVPGALIPSLYFDWLRRRRAAPLARVFAHNRDDVLSLAALVGWFGAALGAAPALRAEEWAGLGHLWEPVDLERGLGCYRSALEAGLAGEPAHWVRLRLAWWEKRAARWETACALWDVARQRELFDPRPWEELAKFQEHRARDFAAARVVVTDALDLARAAGAADGVLAAFGHRLGRIERRLGLHDPAGAS